MMRSFRFWLLPFLMISPACSIKNLALTAVADGVSGAGGGLAEHDDPKFVALAAPFGLTTMETLAKSLPKHRPVRLALADGYTSYAYAFFQQDADRLEDTDITQAQGGWERAKNFYLRARGYALDGLDIGRKGARKVFLGSDRDAWEAKLTEMKKEDVPYLYWLGASWALAISSAKNEPGLIGDLTIVNKIMERAFYLDESWNQGSIHEFFVSFLVPFALSDGERIEAAKKAKWHRDRALFLSHGTHLSVWVAYAENVLIPSQGVISKEIRSIVDPVARQEAINQLNQQLHEEFVVTLKQVVDTNIYFEDPEWKQHRLANVIAQNRAKWLLSRQSELFVN